MCVSVRVCMQEREREQEKELVRDKERERDCHLDFGTCHCGALCCSPSVLTFFFLSVIITVQLLLSLSEDVSGSVCAGGTADSTGSDTGGAHGPDLPQKL